MTYHGRSTAVVGKSLGLEGSSAGVPRDGKIERQSGRYAGGGPVAGWEFQSSSGGGGGGGVLGDFTAREVESGADYRCCQFGNKVVR